MSEISARAVRRAARGAPARRGGTLPPCCLPGASSGAFGSSFLDALDARPSAVLALAAALMLAFGPSPVSAGEMVLVCTQNGLKQVPVDGTSGPDSGTTGCAHACMVRERRRG